MAGKSKIEWTDATWNPVRGCHKISAGCKHCYAATFAERWRGTPGHPYEQGFDPMLVPHKIFDPLLWVKSRTVFVNSMSDLFLEDVPDAYIAAVFEVMLAADWHIFQVLTKRPERMASFVAKYFPNLHEARHIWLGVSVENKRHGLPRIPILNKINAGVRFLSVEPLLEDLGSFDLNGIDWVIVGGESGPGARPLEYAWVANIRELCDRFEKRFFFKQWGGVRKHKTGRLLDGRTYDDMPRVITGRADTTAERQQRVRMIQRKYPDVIPEIGQTA